MQDIHIKRKCCLIGQAFAILAVGCILTRSMFPAGLVNSMHCGFGGEHVACSQSGRQWLLGGARQQSAHALSAAAALLQLPLPASPCRPKHGLSLPCAGVQAALTQTVWLLM